MKSPRTPPPEAMIPRGLGAGESLRDRFSVEPDLRRRTQWLILWRLVFTSSLLLLTAILGTKEGGPPLFPLRPVYGLIAVQFFCSLLYILANLRWKSVKPLAVVQLAVDGLLASGLVLVTGGVGSFLIYIYFFIIGSAGIFFYRSGGLLAAAYLGTLYGVVLFLQYREAWPGPEAWSWAPSSYPWGFYVYQWGLAVAGFFFVGFLGSWLPEQFSRQRHQLVQQQKDIDQLEEVNRLIIHNLDMGLITLNDRRQILTINPAGKKILGREEAALHLLTVDAVLPEMGSLSGWPELSPGQRFEVPVPASAGGTLYLGFSVSTLVDGPNSDRGRIVTFKDLTQIHEMEEHLRQMDRLAMMGQMAAGIVHEVKNPLASISGSIQMLREELREDGSGDRLVNLISREVEKLDILLNDFLTFARPSQQAEQLVDLGDLIPGTIELIRKNKGVPGSIRWEIELEPDLHLRVPPSEFSQILWNLLTNAVQAIPESGLVRIEGRRLEEGKYAGGIEIRVEDNGPGIPAENFKKIFTPFFTTKDKGIGLGLSIVQKIVSQNGGLIRIQNRPAGGTEVLLLFPDPEKRALTVLP